ncbi:MAG: amidophosphoribosyltransferase [Candidatus Nealsonbacteria bacterium]|nr:amidophosphoribosyltransferase [Candidatus Nealsonbacteria bacterium]
MDCGIFGIVEKKLRLRNFKIHRGLGTANQAFNEQILNEMGEIGWKIFYALKGLQHRGDASCGMAVSDNAAVGHDRYSTSGVVNRANIQPIEGNFRGCPFALGHNGNLVNILELKIELAKSGVILEEEASDTRIIVKLIETSAREDFFEAVQETLPKLKGAFSLIILFRDKIIGVKDPFGIRPLCFGESDSCFALSSESCALDHLGIELVKEIEPGELILIDAKGAHSKKWAANTKKKICLFEFIYFARPDSVIDGVPVYRAQKLMGRFLAQEHPRAVILAEAIVPILDSAKMAGHGFHEFTNIILLEEALFRGHFTFEKRTFLQDEPDYRKLGVRLKFNPIKFDIGGKRVIVIDDSIVKGTTSPVVVNLLKSSKKLYGKVFEGAGEVYFLVASPPYRFPCYYGIDTGRINEEPIAQVLEGDIEKVREWIGADYLGYLSLENTIRSVTESDLNSRLCSSDFCAACFTGDYPIRPEGERNV